MLESRKPACKTLELVLPCVQHIVGKPALSSAYWSLIPNLDSMWQLLKENHNSYMLTPFIPDWAKPWHIPQSSWRPRGESMRMWQFSQIQAPCLLPCFTQWCHYEPFQYRVFGEASLERDSWLILSPGAYPHALTQGCREQLRGGGQELQVTTEPENREHMAPGSLLLCPFCRWANWGLDSYCQSGSDSLLSGSGFLLLHLIVFRIFHPLFSQVP